MIKWFSENISTIIICATLSAILTAIVIHMIRDKEKGKSSCGCGCENCAINGQCHDKK